VPELYGKVRRSSPKLSPFVRFLRLLPSHLALALFTGCPWAFPLYWATMASMKPERDVNTTLGRYLARHRPAAANRSGRGHRLQVILRFRAEASSQGCKARRLRRLPDFVSALSPTELQGYAPHVALPSGGDARDRFAGSRCEPRKDRFECHPV